MSRSRPDLREFTARLGTLAWLTLVWVLLWGSVAPGTVAAGLLVALGVTFLLPLPRVPVEGKMHPVSTLVLLAVIAWYFLTSSIQVAWQAIRPTARPESAALWLPLRLRSDFVMALAVSTLNLVPGGIVVRIDLHRRAVLIHVLDAGNPASVASMRHQVEVLERLFVRAFERPEDWRPGPLNAVAYYSEDDADAGPEGDIAAGPTPADDPAIHSGREETR